jgi:hypothetical protein
MVVNVGWNVSLVPLLLLPGRAPGPYCKEATCAGVTVKSERVGDVEEGPAPPLERPCMSMCWDGEDEGGMKPNWFAELCPPIWLAGGWGPPCGNGPPANPGIPPNELAPSGVEIVRCIGCDIDVAGPCGPCGGGCGPGPPIPSGLENPCCGVC